LALLGIILYFFSSISATALTYKLVANEKACFFTNVNQQGAKIAFYFAVSLLQPFLETLVRPWKQSFTKCALPI